MKIVDNHGCSYDINISIWYSYRQHRDSLKFWESKIAKYLVLEKGHNFATNLDGIKMKMATISQNIQ